MKKNFLMVASLLIAAMLLVVSCAQEVKAPENNGLVEAVIAVDFGKDVSVSSLSSETITYEYTFIPKWNILDDGTEPYGAVRTLKKVTNKSTVAGETVSHNIGYVTPGLWEVYVVGYVDYDTNKAKVLEGTRTVYVNNTNTSQENSKVTVNVLVAPVSEGVGIVDIKLQMQDLGEDKKIKYSISNVNGENPVSGEIAHGDKADGKGDAFKYEEKVSGVTAGFNTISLTVDGYEGGITKTFLLVPGKTITVSGSVYPSLFKNVDISIFTVDVNKGTMTIKETSAANNVSVADGLYTLKADTSYTFQYIETNNNYVSDEEKTAAGLTGDFSKKFEWYVNGVKDEDALNQASYTKNFGTAYGDYSVTCKIIYTYTEGSDVTTWIGDASIGKIRVPSTN